MLVGNINTLLMIHVARQISHKLKRPTKLRNVNIFTPEMRFAMANRIADVKRVKKSKITLEF